MNLSKNMHMERYFSSVYFSSLPIYYSTFKFLGEWLAQRNQLHGFFGGRVLSPGLRGTADCVFLSQILVQVCQQVISRPWRGWSSPRWEILGSRMVWSCLWDGAPGSGQGWSSVGAGGVLSLALMEPIIFHLSFSSLFAVIFWVLLQLGVSKPCLSVLDAAGDLNLWWSVVWSRSTQPSSHSPSATGQSRGNKTEKLVGQGDPLPISVTGKTDSTWGKWIYCWLQ